MKKIKLIFGNGFIGNHFLSLPNTYIVNKRINVIKDIYSEIEKFDPEIIINCIGKTGKPNVDWCEYHKDDTFFSNVTIPSLMAEACEDLNIYVVHIGSGCIYEGEIYKEEDTPNFRGSFYSRTKIYSEQILNFYKNVLQVRIRMPIDDKPSPKNLITKLINYKKVINIPNSVTCIPDLIVITNKLIEKRHTGIYNVVNRGPITHKEILEMYRDIVDNNFIMPEFISLEELDTVAKRSNCVLDTKKLENIGIKIRESRDAIADCMEKYGEYKTYL